MTTTELTLQEYFDRAVKHLHSLPRQATNTSTGYCQYLTDDGLKCIVGAFIPDGHEAQSNKGGVLTLAEDHPDLAGIAWPDDTFGSGARMAFELQSDVHDEPNNWTRDGFNNPEILLDIAERYDLNPAVVTARRWPK